MGKIKFDGGILAFSPILVEAWNHLVMLYERSEFALLILWSVLYLSPLIVFICSILAMYCLKNKYVVSKSINRSKVASLIIAIMAIIPLPFGETGELGFVYVHMYVLVSCWFAFVLCAGIIDTLKSKKRNFLI